MFTLPTSMAAAFAAPTSAGSSSPFNLPSIPSFTPKFTASGVLDDAKAKAKGGSPVRSRSHSSWCSSQVSLVLALCSWLTLCVSSLRLSTLPVPIICETLLPPKTQHFLHPPLPSPSQSELEASAKKEFNKAESKIAAKIPESAGGNKIELYSGRY